MRISFCAVLDQKTSHIKVTPFDCSYQSFGISRIRLGAVFDQ
jgi:hypothetical protein